MQVSITSNVLLALGYAAGYALCDRNSVVQWAWRASITATSAVLYVTTDTSTDGALLLVLAVALATELCDGHRDAVGLTQCVFGTAVLGMMGGDAMADVDQAGWVPIVVASVMALLVPSRVAGWPSVDALALVLAAVVPVNAALYEACFRVLGLWAVLVVMVYADDPPHGVPLYKLVYIVVTPWTVACLVGITQLAAVLQRAQRRSQDGSLGPAVLV